MNLDLKDKKIIYELDKNSRISLTRLAKKVRMSKESVHYRINKLIENKIILKFHTVPAHYRFGTIDYKVYLRLQDINRKEYEDLIAFLMQNKDVFWVTPSNGRWDLMFGIRSTSMNEFFKIHDEIMDRFSKHVQEKQLSISRKAIQFNRKWMLSTKEERQVFDFGEDDKKTNLDKEDRLILNELVNNSRKKITEISKNTMLTIDTVKYRLRKMERDNIIKGYKCLFNAEKLGLVATKAFIYFKDIDETRKSKFIEYVKSLDNSVNIVLTFAPWDLEIIFETESYEKYYQTMEKIKEEFTEIIKFYESTLMLAERKQEFDRTE